MSKPLTIPAATLDAIVPLLDRYVRSDAEDIACDVIALAFPVIRDAIALHFAVGATSDTVGPAGRAVALAIEETIRSMTYDLEG